MIAKLIVHGPDRATALARLRRALAETQIAGVTTNVAFLGRIAASGAFSCAELDTGLIERNRAELFPARTPATDEMLALAALAELAEEEREAREAARAAGEPNSPWHQVDGWRVNSDSHHDFVFLDGGERRPVRVLFTGSGRLVQVGEHALETQGLKGKAVRQGSDWHVFHDGEQRRLSLQSELTAPEEELRGSLAAPMPGKVIKLLVDAGAKVKKGEPLLILEAMKMEHTITAPADGTVKEIHFSAGEQVLEGAQLITLQ
jgi:3-methylcrotonyl-CoA carboxylase alpha subunit